MCDPWDLRITSYSIIHGPIWLFLHLQTIPSPWQCPTLNSGFCFFLSAWRLSSTLEAGLGAHRYNLEGRGEQAQLPPGINFNHWVRGLAGTCCTDHVHLVSRVTPSGDQGASWPSVNRHRLSFLFTFLTSSPELPGISFQKNCCC